MVQFALLFGTTWFVNALVFIGVLVAVLAAIEISRRWTFRPPRLLYLLLLFCLAVAAGAARQPAKLDFLPRFVCAVLLAFTPILIANLIFAQRFKDVAELVTAFGANLLGAMLGGILEYLSLLTGYRALLIVVAVLYGLLAGDQPGVAPPRAPCWLEAPRSARAQSTTRRPCTEGRAMTADPGSGEARLRELAERLMTHPHPEGGIATQLFVGELPDGLATELPLPPGAILIGSSLQRLGGRPASMEAVLDMDGEPSAILDAYDAAAASLGWAPFTGFGPPHGGFMSMGMGDGRMLRRGSDGPMLITSAVAREGAPTDVRLRLDWESFRHMPEGPRGMPPGAELLPALRPPSGVTMRGVGSSGGDGRWTSEATVQTDRSVADLDEHFSTQLVHAGWVRSAGGSDGAAAWSAWSLPAADSWRGVLLVLAPYGPGTGSCPCESSALRPTDRVATSPRPPGSRGRSRSRAVVMAVSAAVLTFRSAAVSVVMSPMAVPLAPTGIASEQEFEAFARGCSPQLFGIVMAILLDRGEAEDAVQEAPGKRGKPGRERPRVNG